MFEETCLVPLGGTQLDGAPGRRPGGLAPAWISLLGSPWIVGRASRGMSGVRLPMQPMTTLGLGIVALVLAWKLRRRGSGGNQAAKRIPMERPHSPLPGSTPHSSVPWPRGRDLSGDQLIRARLPAQDWFNLTDAARALQNVPPGRKPSGSAGRDARALVDRWLRRGIVEVRRFGPSRRRFFRFA